MTHSRATSYAALALGTFALVISSLAVAGGLAEAAGHKIGKNLVVAKSIKNGAVPRPKVKAGSLPTADLAPGPIPPPGSGKSIVVASKAVTPTAAHSSILIA